MTNHGLLVLESLSQLEAKLFRNSGRCLFIVDTSGCGGAPEGCQERLRSAGETQESRRDSGEERRTSGHLPTPGRGKVTMRATPDIHILYHILHGE